MQPLTKDDFDRLLETRSLAELVNGYEQVTTETFNDPADGALVTVETRRHVPPHDGVILFILTGQGGQ